MQTASTATAAHPAHLGQPWSNPAHMYPNSSAHQRNTASPRAYDTSAAGAQAGDDQYTSYQQAAGFGGLGSAGYSYGSQMNMYNTSPQLPSGSSRRTSNPKASPTQPTSATAATSPSAYYPRQTQQADVTQSPYQQSAQAHLPQQQYGGYYPYHDQYAHHQGGQWQQSYNTPSNFAQPRQSSSGSMAAGTATSTSDPSQPSRPSGGSFDYSSTSQGQQQQYQNWDTSRQAQSHQWPQQASTQGPSQQQAASQQTTSQQSRSTGSSGQQQSVVSPWQGYGAGAHQPFPPPPQPVPHMGGQLPPGQYGWNNWQGQPGYGGYPPAAAHQAQTAPAPAAAAPATAAAPAAAAPPAPAAAQAAPTGKGKKSKKAAAEAPATSPVLGKRSSEDGANEVKEKPSKKKGKKEEEKPAPKAPTKSHLKPPRQAPSAWQLFFADELNKAKAAAAAEAGTTPGGTPIHPKLNVAQIAKDAGAAYAALSDDRKAYYARKVEEGKIQYQKDLVTWQATLTPEDIKAENAFRAQQRKDGKSRKGNLKDPNAPKKPLSAYFLFLKGIRENDDLRKSVWAEESETTRQSVLAAERWRGLSDDEKRPYLQQAEKDKQEYEALRKIYEDDAAARARGESANDRPVFKEIESALINPPKSLLEPRKEGEYPAGSDAPKVDTGESTVAEPIKKTTKKKNATTNAKTTTTTAAAAAASKNPTISTTTVNPISTFTVAPGSTPDPDTKISTATTGSGFDPSLEIDEFHGFDDMDLTGLEGMTGHGESAEGQWDHLQYMDGAEGGNAEAAAAAVEAAAAAVERKAKASA